jgi:DNA-directed RNA polymerase subunit M/transcription elongation factor TFIIS
MTGPGHSEELGCPGCGGSLEPRAGDDDYLLSCVRCGRSFIIAKKLSVTTVVVDKTKGKKT